VYTAVLTPAEMYINSNTEQRNAALKSFNDYWIKTLCFTEIAARCDFFVWLQRHQVVLNRTELTWFSFWRANQQASMASLLVIGWRVRERSHVSQWRR